MIFKNLLDYIFNFCLYFQDKCHYVFADEINKYVFTTSNCGETIKSHKLDQITPSVITFEENRNDVFLIHDLKDPEKRLYVTKNFGETYDVVQRYVRNFFFHYTETETKLYVERIQPQRDDSNSKDDIKVSVCSVVMNLCTRNPSFGFWKFRGVYGL